MTMQNLLGSLTPAGNFSNGGPIALGTAVRFSVPGWVYGVRMFIHPDFNPFAHAPYSGEFWESFNNVTGVRLAKKNYVVTAPNDWCEVLFDTPVPVTADKPYRSIYYAASGFYNAVPHFFQTADVVNGDIVGYLHDSAAPGYDTNIYNGTYVETADPDEHYTKDTFNQNCYLSDVIFSTTDPGSGGGDPGEASRFLAFF